MLDNTINCVLVDDRPPDYSTIHTLEIENETLTYPELQAILSNMCNLTTLKLNNITIVGCDAFKGMFIRNRKLVHVEITNLHAPNLETCRYLFCNLSSLEYVDLSNWDTPKLTNLSKLFKSCSNLQKVCLSNIVTSNITIMDGMFDSCARLKHIDVTNWDTSNVKDMCDLFCGCKALDTIIGFDRLDMNKVTNISYMFCGCKSLSHICLNFDLSRFQGIDEFVDGVIVRYDNYPNNIKGLFMCCDALVSLEVSCKQLCFEQAKYLVEHLFDDFDYDDPDDYLVHNTIIEVHCKDETFVINGITTWSPYHEFDP